MTKSVVEQKPKRCSSCNSTQIYYRVKTDDYQCQKCGYCGKSAVKE